MTSDEECAKYKNEIKKLQNEIEPDEKLYMKLELLNSLEKKKLWIII